MPGMRYQSFLEKDHDLRVTWKCEGQDSCVAPEAERNFCNAPPAFYNTFYKVEYTFSICTAKGGLDMMFQ